jgi:hypothetical protein
MPEGDKYVTTEDIGTEPGAIPEGTVLTVVDEVEEGTAGVGGTVVFEFEDADGVTRRWATDSEDGLEPQEG